MHKIVSLHTVANIMQRRWLKAKVIFNVDIIPTVEIDQIMKKSISVKRKKRMLQKRCCYHTLKERLAQPIMVNGTR